VGGTTRSARTRASSTARRVLSPSSIALALLAMGSLGVAALQWSVAHRGQPKPVTRFTVEPPRDVRIAIREISASAVAIPPDGNTVAFLATAADGTRRLYVREQSRLEARALPGTEGAGQPFFSPDGRSIGFFAAGRLQRIGVDGGSPQSMREAPEYTR